LWLSDIKIHETCSSSKFFINSDGVVSIDREGNVTTINRVATQQGAKYLEMAQGGHGVLLGGVPGVDPGTVVVIGVFFNNLFDMPYSPVALKVLTNR